MDPSPRRVERDAGAFSIGAAFRPIAWIVGAQAVLATWADADLWGHLRFGLDLLRDRRLTTTDPYSFTQDLPWVNHEWLSELAMALAYSLGGNAGLMVLRGLFAAVVVLLLAHATRHAADRWRWPVLAIVFAGMIPLAGTVRPQLWTLLLVAALCRLLSAGGRWLVLVPPLLAVWANAHGGWILGLGMLAAWAGGQAIEPYVNPRATRTPIAPLALVVSLSIAATLVTPYGWHLWQFILETVRLSRSDITEWQPIWRTGVANPLLWAAGAGLVVVFVRSRGWPPLGAAAIIAMLAYSSLRVTRLVPLFMVATAMLLAPRFPAREAGPPDTRAKVVLDVATTVMALLLMLQTSVLPRCIAITGPWIPDLAAAADLEAARPSGRLVTSFNWGQFALWHFGPALRVSIDGRRETIYSDDTLDEQRAILLGEPKGFAALERIRPEYVWLPIDEGRATRDWLQANGYRIDVETSRSFVAVREDLPALVDSDPVVSACFPGSE
ncbi:MAG: hypothetical protein AB7F99_07935 [Vicinamibacterales bacterium]